MGSRLKTTKNRIDRLWRAGQIYQSLLGWWGVLPDSTRTWIKRGIRAAIALLFGLVAAWTAAVQDWFGDNWQVVAFGLGIAVFAIFGGWLVTEYMPSRGRRRVTEAPSDGEGANGSEINVPEIPVHHRPPLTPENARHQAALRVALEQVTDFQPLTTDPFELLPWFMNHGRGQWPVPAGRVVRGSRGEMAVESLLSIRTEWPALRRHFEGHELLRHHDLWETYMAVDIEGRWSLFEFLRDRLLETVELPLSEIVGQAPNTPHVHPHLLALAFNQVFPVSSPSPVSQDRLSHDASFQVGSYSGHHIYTVGNLEDGHTIFTWFGTLRNTFFENSSVRKARSAYSDALGQSENLRRARERALLMPRFPHETCDLCDPESPDTRQATGTGDQSPIAVDDSTVPGRDQIDLQATQVMGDYSAREVLQRAMEEADMNSKRTGRSRLSPDHDFADFAYFHKGNVSWPEDLRTALSEYRRRIKIQSVDRAGGTYYESHIVPKTKHFIELAKKELKSSFGVWF